MLILQILLVLIIVIILLVLFLRHNIEIVFETADNPHYEIRYSNIFFKYTFKEGKQ